MGSDLDRKGFGLGGRSRWLAALRIGKGGAGVFGRIRIDGREGKRNQGKWRVEGGVLVETVKSGLCLCRWVQRCTGERWVAVKVAVKLESGQSTREVEDDMGAGRPMAWRIPNGQTRQSCSSRRARAPRAPRLRAAACCPGPFGDFGTSTSRSGRQTSRHHSPGWSTARLGDDGSENSMEQSTIKARHGIWPGSWESCRVLGA